MAKLIYSSLTSLDGYVNDASGNFDWCIPSEEVFLAVNEIERPLGTYLYGRRMYETMAVWENWDLDDEPEGAEREYQRIWRKADKVVFSETVDAASTPRTRVERRVDPVAILELKQHATSDLSVGGATLAGHLVRAGLVDEFHQFISPIIVGGGTRYLPERAVEKLELIDTRRFENGVVHVHYRQKR